MNRYQITLIKYKTVEILAEDEMEAKESEEVQSELSHSEGWELADAQAELLPDGK